MAGRIAYYGNIATQGLVLNLDAAIQGSYPKTGSTWFDISNNGNNGTLTNGPLYTGSDYGAIRFDGTNDYVSLPTVVPTETTSLNVWFKTTEASTSQMLITSDDSNFPQIRNFQYRLDSGKLGILVFETDSTFSMISSSMSSSNGNWTNTTATYDRSYLKLYINGAPVNQISSTFPINDAGSSGEFMIGSRRNSSPADFFTGSISISQVYSRGLSQFEVFQNFNAYKSRYGIPDIVTDGLVLNLDAGNPYSYLSGSSGTTWTNTVAVSSSISGTLVNGPVYSNGAITFDGVNDYVKLTSNSSVDINTLTWSAFVQGVYSSQPGFFFIGNDVGASISPYKIFIGVINSGGLKLRINYNNVATVNLGSLTDNTLYHLTITYDGTTTNMYVNGSSIGTSTNMSGNLNSKTFSYIGSTAGATEFFNGKIFNTLLYNRALSAAEVQQNFNALRGRYGI